MRRTATPMTAGTAALMIFLISIHKKTLKRFFSLVEVDEERICVGQDSLR